MTVPPHPPTGGADWARPEAEAARAQAAQNHREHDPRTQHPPVQQGRPAAQDPRTVVDPVSAGAGDPERPDARPAAMPHPRQAQAPRAAAGPAPERQAIPGGRGGMQTGAAPAWPGARPAGTGPVPTGGGPAPVGSGPVPTGGGPVPGQAPPAGASAQAQAPQQRAAGGQQGGQMLGDDQLAAAAQAAARHTSSRIIDTSSGREDGLNKCPRCGSSDIHYSLTSHALVCSYCRHEWNEEVAEQKFGLDSSIAELQGHTLASGTADVREDLTVVTLKCQGCGAEVVINVDQEMQARCHWCRQTLSINSQIPNGSVPDAVLPFLLTREQAVEQIGNFVGSRRTFADARFKREFVPENVMGVYMPYMVVDGNLHAVLRGTGEVTTRQYTVRRKVGDRTVSETYYDADVYTVQRAFDLLVDDLAVESARRFNAEDNASATNNILNAVQPYDTEQAVVYNSNYLKGFTSERRDLNVRDIDGRVEDHFLSIARAKVRPTVNRYDRGVRWQEEGLAVRGTRWVSVYVPVWLYSYYDASKGQDSLVHYIAVNGRNGTTMGSVPVSHPKIAAVSCAAGAVAAVLGGLVGIAMFLGG